MIYFLGWLNFYVILEIIHLKGKKSSNPVFKASFYSIDHGNRAHNIFIPCLLSECMHSSLNHFFCVCVWGGGGGGGGGGWGEREKEKNETTLLYQQYMSMAHFL